MIKPMPPYFIVSIPRKEQAERKSKIGHVYLHPNFVYMTRGMQCGQIVAIGDTAHETMPEARLGDTLLLHHFVESTEKQFCITSDQHFHYYVVTCMSHNGQNNQTYGIYNGSKIIAHPDYVFLDCQQPTASDLTPEEYLTAQLKAQESGIVTFKDWKVDREEITKRIQAIKAQVDQLTKSRMSPELKEVIEGYEAEMNRLSKLMTKQQFQLYKLIAGSQHFFDMVKEQYETSLKVGDNIYMLNIACDTKMEFNKREFIVAKSQHFGAPQEWAKRMVLRQPEAMAAQVSSR